MESIKNMAKDNSPSNQAVAWLKSQLGEPVTQEADTDRAKEEAAQQKLLLANLQKQQEEIQRQIADITMSTNTTSQGQGPTSQDRTDQAALLEQIRTSLAPKEADRDPNKALMRALMTAQNKTIGCSGTSTLKPDIFSKISGEGEFSMAEWLASLNKQEEGESEVNKLINKIDEELDCRNECRHSKMKSGMLDKSTTNI